MKPTKKDYDRVAEAVVEELAKRKAARKDREAIWKEVDRQVALTPVKEDKVNPSKRWVPEFELPWQADTLEVLVADTDRMLFPDTAEWFDCDVEMTDDSIARFEEEVTIAGDASETPFHVSQGNMNAVAQAALQHTHRQYDIRKHTLMLAAEAFKYGTYAARVRQVKRKTFTNDFRGVSSEETSLPVLVPISIWNTYLDDAPMKSLNQGTMVGPQDYFCYSQKLQDLRMAAKNPDIENQDGGWRLAEVNKLESPDEGKKEIELIDVDGDLIIEKLNGKSGFYPNMCITVAVSKGGPKVIRIRENKLPFHPVMHGVYYQDEIGVYGTSPLMKGKDIQRAATACFISLAQASKLNAEPVIRYDMNDPAMAAMGGPQVYPSAMWSSMSDIDTIEIGSPDQLLTVFMGLRKEYENITGVTDPRMGGQTKSHQTADAVQTETEKGQSRTVSFIRGMARGFLTNVLHAEWEILKRTLTRSSIYIQKYRGYVEFGRDALPDNIVFLVTGAAGPSVRKRQEAELINAYKQLTELEPAAVQAGGKPLNHDKFREEIIGNVIPESDAKDYFNEAPQSMPGPTEAAGGMAAALGGAGVPGAPAGTVPP